MVAGQSLVIIGGVIGVVVVVVVVVRFRSILYTEDRGEVEDRRDTTGMNVVWGIR